MRNRTRFEARAPALVFLVASALLATGLVLGISEFFPLDDAYISFRYAKNWAAGLGPVFNPGERVEGYSNFLFVAALAALERWGVTPPLAARWLNLASVLGVLATLLWALPGHLRSSRFRFVAVLLFALASLTLTNTLSGLEAPLAAFLLLGAAVAFDTGSSRIAAPLCLALALTRPEGAAVGLVLAAADALRSRSRARAPGGPLVTWFSLFLLPFGVYLLWRWSFYGSYLPNSVSAKMGFGRRENLRLSWEYSRRFFVMYWPAMTLAAVGILSAIRSRLRSATGHPAGRLPMGHLLSFMVVVALVLQTGSGDPYLSFLRYLFPVLPLLLVMAVWGAEEVRPAARGSRARRIGLASAGILLVLLQFYLAVHLPRRSTHASGVGDALASGVRAFVSQDRNPHPPGASGVSQGLHQVAAWLVDHAAGSASVATAEVGIVPYYSGLETIDTFGLVTEEIGRLAAPPGSKFNPEFVFSEAPDYFVFKKRRRCMCSGIPADAALFEDARLKRGYRLARAFPDGELVILLLARRQAPDLVAVDICRDWAPEFVEVSRKGSEPGPKVVSQRRYARQRTASRLRGIVETMSRSLDQGRHDLGGEDVVADWLACYEPQLPTKQARDVSLRYRFLVPDQAVLGFDYGFPEEQRNKISSGSIRFVVEVVDGGVAMSAFEGEAAAGKSAVWKHGEMDLAPFSGREIEIRLRVLHSLAKSDGSVFNSGWRNLVVRAPSAAGQINPKTAD